MSSTSDNLSTVLDAAREALPEGDYLKVANFLPSLLKKGEAIPYNVRIYDDLNITVEFETVKGNKYSIKIDKVSVKLFRNSDPNITLITGSINDVSFIDMDEIKLMKKITTIALICGIVKIKRTVDDIVEEWDHFNDYKKHDHEINFGWQEDYDEDEYSNIRTGYYIERLMGNTLWDHYA